MPRIFLFCLCALFIWGLGSCAPQTPSSSAPETRVTSASPAPQSARSRNNASGSATPLPQSPLDPLPKGTALPAGTQSYIQIFKREAMLEYWVRRPDDARFVLYERFPICAFSGDLGPKLKEGDHQSPEGFYRVSKGSLNPGSKYHRAFNLGFPNAYDRHHGRTGSYLMVHGDCVSIGCYAMTDGGISVIYGLVEDALSGGKNAEGHAVEGQPYVPVHIFPFRLSDAALAAQSGNQWHSFWKNLKLAYDTFEETGIPAVMVHKNGRYAVAG